MRDLRKNSVLVVLALGLASCGRLDVERRGVSSLNVGVGFDGAAATQYLTQGGQPAPLWLAGAAGDHARVTAIRTPGRGAGGADAAAKDVDVVRVRPAEHLEADVSQPTRLTWGCGGDFEFRTAETTHPRLVAETVVICGAHHLDDAEVRLDVRAHNLILRGATIDTESEGYFDLRANVLTLDGASRIVSRAPSSVEPPFSTSASVNVSATAIEGTGRLDVTSHGADYRRVGGK